MLHFARYSCKLVVVVNRTFQGALDVVVDAADPIVFEFCAVSAEYSAGTVAHHRTNLLIRRMMHI